MLDPGRMNKPRTLRLSPALIACAASSRSSIQTTSQKERMQLELFRRWEGAELRTSTGSQSAAVLGSSRSAQLAIEYRSHPVERTDNKAALICAPHSAPVLLVARAMQRVAFVHLEPHGDPVELVMERRERKNVACMRLVSSLEQHKHFVCTTVGATPLSVVPVAVDSRPKQRVYLLMGPESNTIKKKCTERRLEPSRSQLLVAPKGPLVAKSLTARYLDVLYGSAIEGRRAVIVKPTAGVVYPLVVWQSLEHRVVASRVVVLPLTTPVNLKETLHPLRQLAVRLSTVKVVTPSLVQHVLIDDDDVREEQGERETRLMRSVSTVTCFSSRSTEATADSLYECESISESDLVTRSSEHSADSGQDQMRQEDSNGELNRIVYFMRQFVKDIDQISSRRPLTHTWAAPTPSSAASAATSANESLGRPRKVHLTDAGLRTNR